MIIFVLVTNEAALLAVKQVEKERKEKMATKIQTKWRAYSKRKDFVRTRKLILRVQATV